MKELDTIKSSLMACVMGRMSDLENTDAKELGEVVDMIKDIEEAKYYCSITEAMDKRSKSDETQDKIDNALMMERLKTQSDTNYYGGRMSYPYPYMYYPERMSHDDSRMYYDGRDRRRGSYNYTEKSYTEPNVSIPSNVRDYREGKSYVSRRGYMESKENHMDDKSTMDKLERYITELDEDLSEMSRDSTPQEKTMIRERLIKTAQKIV